MLRQIQAKEVKINSIYHSYSASFSIISWFQFVHKVTIFAPVWFLTLAVILHWFLADQICYIIWCTVYA